MLRPRRYAAFIGRNMRSQSPRQTRGKKPRRTALAPFYSFGEARLPVAVVFQGCDVVGAVYAFAGHLLMSPSVQLRVCLRAGRVQQRARLVNARVSLSAFTCCDARSAPFSPARTTHALEHEPSCSQLDLTGKTYFVHSNPRKGRLENRSTKE